MFDDEVIVLLRRNSDVIEIQSEKMAQAARAILDALQPRSKNRVLNNIIIMKQCLRKITEEFEEIKFLVD